MMKKVLLMTACINPKGMSNTILQDVEIRREQYVNAINYYLANTHYDILFVENSGNDISYLFTDFVKEGRIEFLVFEGNNFDKSLGKGYGEGLIVRYAISHSSLLSEKVLVIKVSGRHVVKNISLIERLVCLFTCSEKFVACDVNPKSGGANSDMFMATSDFFSYFSNLTYFIDESKHVWFEHILYEAIEDYVHSEGNFIYLPMPLYQKGISGSVGTKLPVPSVSLFLKHIIKFVLYKLNLKRL